MAKSNMIYPIGYNAEKYFQGDYLTQHAEQQPNNHIWRGEFCFQGHPCNHPKRENIVNY